MSAVIVTVQVPVPEHPPPDQPENVEPPPGTALRLRVVLAAKPDTEQVAPQFIDPSDDVMVPVPDLETDRVKVVGPDALVVNVLSPDVLRLPDASRLLTL